MLDVKVKFNLPPTFEREVGDVAVNEFRDDLVTARGEILKDFHKGPMDRDAAELLVQKAQASVLTAIDDNDGGIFFEQIEDDSLLATMRVEVKGDLAEHFFSNINS